MRKVQDITIIAAFTAILFIQEQALSFLPNIQLTVFLLVLYSKVFKLWKVLIMIVIHVLLDNLFMGSFSIYYFPFMLIGWLVIPLVINIFFKNNENPIILAIVGFCCSFIYCWMFALPQVLFTETNLIVYLTADFLFEVILAISSFLTILWLFKPCYKIMKDIESKY